MRWNRHLNLQGEHAFLSPSQYHWINYNHARLLQRWTAAQAGAYGNMQHEYAQQEIKAKRESGLIGTVGQYINDAIRYRMETEQVLYYSENCFGTPDAISFVRNLLRIHDLKTGKVTASFHQLETYAALFCLEYGHDPFRIKIELRIYQADEVSVLRPDPEVIGFIMEKIVEFDNVLEHRKREEAS
jgi:hypothetical protein